MNLVLFKWTVNAGPYAYVQYTPGEPIASNNPNKGSVKRRNAKKRIGQRRAFILVCMCAFFLSLLHISLHYYKC